MKTITQRSLRAPRFPRSVSLSATKSESRVAGLRRLQGGAPPLLPLRHEVGERVGVRSRHLSLFLGTPGQGRGGGFTILELLVVIAIMGILAAVGLPAIRGMSKSNAMAAADRQLLDDLAYARQLALSDHTTVYMVFVPSNIVNTAIYRNVTNNDPVAAANLALYRGQFTSYAMMSLRSVGDQPGQSNPRYLTDWRSLPNSVFIPQQKYGAYNTNDPDTVRSFAFTQDPANAGAYPATDLITVQGSLNLTAFPFPFVTNTAVQAHLPYIGFDYQGRLVSQKDEYIPLAHGSVLVQQNPDGSLASVPADAEELPAGNTLYSPTYPNNAYNQVHISWLTGRARVEIPHIQ
jgi:prepilin-type N-terminal cleavage/methylation domain-containing protein